MAAQDIGRAAAALAAAPGDLTHWLELATWLAAEGKLADADDAFAKLGEAANRGGHVALAVACSRWLIARRADAAGALVDEIASTHAAGSPKVDPTARPPLPAPRAAPPSAAPVKDLDDALAAAKQAIDAAAAHAVAHAPAKYPPMPLVSSLPAAELSALVEVMTQRAVPANTVVIELGAPADALFWIARGAVRATRGEHVLGELASGAFFGEIALVGGTTRTAKVTTIEDSWLIEIPADKLEAVAARQPRLARVLANHARARLLSNLVRTSELFARMSEEDRAELLGRFSTTLVPAGHTFIEAGKENDFLWVVVSGKCEVRGPDGSIAQIGPGEGVGEMSLLARKPAVADVVTTAPTAMLRLAREEFESIAIKYPELLAEVYKLVVSREQQNRAQVVDASDLVV
ncbi:MAG TPA: cyclic nucleotide-binding domain-containing protein [Kofleriaceae bacterium]|nr:cyclic nucleotide-binding domain-containing protein [Kofleriaceae bacterium]